MRGTGWLAAVAAVVAMVVVSCGGAGGSSAPTSEPGTTTPVTGSSAPTTVPAEPDPGKPATPAAIEGPTALAVDVATGEERWRVSLSPDIVAGTAGDGRIFSIACPSGQVGAADIVTGVTLWTTPVDCREGTPGLLLTTDIVVARTAGALVGLAAETGAERWRVDVPAPLLSFAFAADDGLVVAGTGTGLIAVEATTGAERWQVDLHGTPHTAVMPDGHVVAIAGEPGSSQEELVSLATATGAEVWRQPAEGRGFPVALGDLAVFGTVLPGSPQGPTGPSGGPGSGGVVALDAASGDVVWRRERDVGLPIGPLLTGTSGEMLVASWSSGSVAGPSELTVEALAGDGSVLWETPGSRSLAVVDDVVVVAGGQDGVAGLDGTTGEEQWRLRDTGFVQGAQGGNGIAVVAVMGPEGSQEPPTEVEGSTILEAVGVTDGASRWRTNLEGFALPDPPVVAGDVAAVRACSGPGEQVVSAVDLATGDLNWTWEGGTCDGLGGLASTGSMVVAAGPEGLTALDAGTGEPRFEVPIGDVQRLTANADVVVAATPTEVVVFDAGTGTERWRAPALGAVLVSPVLTDDLVVVPMADSEATAASMAMAVTAFDLATGDVRWTQQVPGMVNGSPVVLGTVLAVDVMDVGVVDSSQPPSPPASPAAPLLLGLDLATGTELWRVTGEGNPFGPTVGGSGTGVVAATWTTNTQEPNGAIHAFGADGQARWVADGLVGLGAGAGLVLASTVEGSSVALDASTGQERWRIVGPASFPGFADDQVLLVHTVGGSH